MLHTEVEIASPPEVVRRIFLEFSKIKEWHTSYVQEITPMAEGPDVLTPGKKLHCSMGGNIVDMTIIENSPARFQWRGDAVMTIVGLHTFNFQPSQAIPGGTNFSQDEEFSGALSPLMVSWLYGSVIKGQFEGFNKDLKAKAEATQKV